MEALSKYLKIGEDRNSQRHSVGFGVRGVGYNTLPYPKEETAKTETEIAGLSLGAFQVEMSLLQKSTIEIPLNGTTDILARTLFHQNW